MNPLDSIIRWAHSKEAIRAVLLTGSLAGKGKTDRLSDFDVAVYGNGFSFVHEDGWLKEIGTYWVCIPDQFYLQGFQIPTRLTIFDAYTKVDFSFHPTMLLYQMIDAKRLPDEYNIGYKVLVDKDGFTAKLPKPAYQGFKMERPTDKAFQENTAEFFFEIYHTAKYLYRDDLWQAKFRDWSAKEWLRGMLEWNAACRSTEDFSPKNGGKGMKDWLDEKRWNDLQDCFGRFEKKDSWQAMKNTVALYEKVGRETAAFLHFEYGTKLNEQVLSFIQDLEQQAPDS